MKTRNGIIEYGEIIVLVNEKRGSNTVLLSTLRGKMSIDNDNLPLTTIHIHKPI